jgi:DNA-binding HxlR family transcriptional regulator
MVRFFLIVCNEIQFAFKGPARFNELQWRMAEEMTHTTLSRQLKTLENEGLIVRREYRQIPPKVEYSLSDIGKKFKDV